MKLASLTLAAVLAATAAAQAQPAPTPLDATTRAATVREAAKTLRDGYVFPDVGVQAAERIEGQLAAGVYDDLSDPAAFAVRLTDDLQGVTHDKHLRVTAQGAPPSARPGVTPFRSEGGIVRADRLAGGVGYIEIAGFPPPGAFRPALDAALAQLSDAKALIIDIRRNGGGSPDSVAYAVSYFVDGAKPMLINDFQNRKAGTTEFTHRATYSSPTPRSFRGRPLYVLTSSRTFSGGEEFAYDVKAFKLGVLVGSTTGGGANPGGARPIAGRFMIFVPGGRPINPVTKTNWEGIGVVPDIATPPADALKVALEKLGQQPASGDIEALSQERLFTPRTTAQAGSDAALRRVVEGFSKGDPSYPLLAPGFAEAMRSDFGRAELPRMQAQLSALGPLQAVSFTGVGPQGLDHYDVRFEKGSLTWFILLSPDGKIETAGFEAPPAPAQAAAR
jgi:C-terminal processing protease CtpA/Prc